MPTYDVTYTLTATGTLSVEATTDHAAKRLVRDMDWKILVDGADVTMDIDEVVER